MFSFFFFFLEKLNKVSPPGTHSELRGAGQFCRCDLPCSGCSAGSAGPLRSAWHGWQQPHAAASARTCLVRSPLLRASAADPLPSGGGEQSKELKAYIISALYCLSFSQHNVLVHKSKWSSIVTVGENITEL